MCPVGGNGAATIDPDLGEYPGPFLTAFVALKVHALQICL
jgi:hypothetical protein